VAEPAFAGPAYRRAGRALDDAVARFRAAGFRRVERLGPLAARVSVPDGGPSLRLELVKEGRVFGGTYAREVSTSRPVLPRSRGLSARGRGLVQMRGIRFRGRRGDEAGSALAASLAADAQLAARLAEVHFERIRVEPDGRPVVRHMGGSVVWMLFPPLVRQIPLVEEQARATASALEAFARAGRRAPTART
jgi:hypothetical protein